MLKLETMKKFLICIFLVLPVFSSYGKEDIAQRAGTYREEGYRAQAKGDVDGALKYYQKAIQIDPLYVEVYNDLGVVYEAVGNEDNAVAMYNKALELAPQYLPAYTNLAFFYEKKGDIEKASYYWQKRYELGKDGEYWKQVARQHLDELNMYPPFVKARQDKEAQKLTEELVYKREQARLKLVEETQLRFETGVSLFQKGDYNAGLKELQIAKFLNPPDAGLNTKIDEFIKKTEEMMEKAKALNFTQEALEYIRSDDFLSAREKLKEAFSVVSDISQK